MYHDLDESEMPEVVRHACDNRACYNIVHLIGGTHSDNVMDMVERGRNAKGSKHHAAKLTEGDIPEIRKRLAAGESQGAIARDYKVNRTAISKIHRGEKWRHIKPACPPP
jgi:hypothetical protein